MGRVCCLKYFFDSLFCFCIVCLFVVVDFFYYVPEIASKSEKKKCDVPEGCGEEPSYGRMHERRIEVASSQSKFLLCLWRSAIGIISPELSNPENERRAVPA